MRESRVSSHLARTILSCTHLTQLRVPLRSTQADALSCRFYLDSLDSPFNSLTNLVRFRFVRLAEWRGLPNYQDRHQLFHLS